MAENCSRKLMVEVSNARNLMPKDGQGTCSAHAVVDFNGQRRRTYTKARDLNPRWDEKLDFTVDDLESVQSETVEVNLYNDKKIGRKASFLGRVKIAGSSIRKTGWETLVYYPLEKRSIFSQVRGEIGLKFWYVNEAGEDPSPGAAAAAAGDSTEPKRENQTTGKPEAKPADEIVTPSALKEDVNKEENEPQMKEDPKQPEKRSEEESEKSYEEGTAPSLVSLPMYEKSSLRGEGENNHGVKSESSPASENRLRALANETEMRSSRQGAGTAQTLVDRVTYLYARIVKAKRPDATVASEAESGMYARLVIGAHTARTKSSKAAEWDQVFAFHRESLSSAALEVSLWSETETETKTKTETEMEATDETRLGRLSFIVSEVPNRVPPDSPLAAQWHTLEGPTEAATEVMMAVWIGSQADEAFPDAWQSDAGGHIPEARAKAYLSPNLWYLRVTVIQAQDLPSRLDVGAKATEVYVKVQMGQQICRTGKVVVVSSSGCINPWWNEDLLFVAAEPFEPFLFIRVEEVGVGARPSCQCQAKVPLSGTVRQLEQRVETGSRWLNLAGGEGVAIAYKGRIHIRTCLEGGYHVTDEPSHLVSDVRASSQQLWAPPIGTLEVGIRGGRNLLPMKTKDGTRGTTDAYSVAKYGPKWFRTRTLLDQFNPRWNEQYAWDVYDPCTVVTIGVFDNGRCTHDDVGKTGRDARMGKVRIRLSTLDTGRLYLSSHALTVLCPGGFKKMGEIELAVRFTCSSWLSMIRGYGAPVLPRMHYLKPLGAARQDALRQTAVGLVVTRLARSEPPLGPEVVEYMLDWDSHKFSLRRSKTNWYRAVRCLTCLAAIARWLHDVRIWSAPTATFAAHLCLVALVHSPGLVLPTLLMSIFFVVMWRYKYRRRTLGIIDGKLSSVDAVSTRSPCADELDEELDAFPTTRSLEHVRFRYDRLRTLAGAAQTLLGDVAAQGERVEALVNWWDPRATGIFALTCLLASVAMYLLPLRLLLLGWGFFFLRHPWFRGDRPSTLANFFRRLPSLSDRLL